MAFKQGHPSTQTIVKIIKKILNKYVYVNILL